MISVNGVELGGTSGSIASTDITDSTSVGRSVLTATDAAAGRAALGFYPRVRAPTSTYPWTLPDAHTLAQVVPTGAQGATSFTDLSANARTVTASSAIVDTTIEGITSTPLYCPAGYLSVDHASASTYVLSTGDFTAEAWITPVGVVSGSPRRIISVGNVDADNGGWTWGLFGDHLNAAVRSGGSNTDYNSTAINALYDGNECFHVALVKTSGVLKMFCRGIPVYSGSCTLAFGVAAKALRIGAREPIATEPPSFRINAVRFSDSARYTGFFIP